MSIKPESKPVISATVNNLPADNIDQKQPIDSALTVSQAAKLKIAIERLNAERTALVKETIENLKPEKSFDSKVVREINKIETRKNRLIVSHFAGLLRKNGSQVQAIVHQIIEL